MNFIKFQRFLYQIIVIATHGLRLFDNCLISMFKIKIKMCTLLIKLSTYYPLVEERDESSGLTEQLIKKAIFEGIIWF